MSDGILTRQEEERLRTFRDNLALEDSSADSKTTGHPRPGIVGPANHGGQAGRHLRP